MEDNTFRQATIPKTTNPALEKVVPQNPDRVIEDATEPPIAMYLEMKGKPYAANYFDVYAYKDMNESLKDDLTLIDRAYIERVSKGTYQDSKKNYEEMNKEAEQVTGTKLSNTSIKIAKIAEYLKFMERIKKIEEDEVE